MLLAGGRRVAAGGQFSSHGKRLRKTVQLPGRLPGVLRGSSRQWLDMTKTGTETSKLPHDLAERIVAEVREDELIAMACEVVNIPSPTGEELAMGNYMQ